MQWTPSHSPLVESKDLWRRTFGIGVFTAQKSGPIVRAFVYATTKRRLGVNLIQLVDCLSESPGELEIAENHTTFW